jgi:hypothetical protein
MGSGDTLLIFTPLHDEPPPNNPATLDLRNLHPVLDFDAATNESAVFSGVMPRNFDGGNLTVYIHYAMTSATTGDVDWDICLERIGDGQQDIDLDGWGAPISSNDNNVPGTCGHVDIISVSLPGNGNIEAGEGFRLKITRDAASDTAAGDAELLFVELKET